MGRIPTGIAEGTVSHFGEFDECIEIEGPTKRNAETIRGQYCLAKVILPYPKLMPSDKRTNRQFSSKQLSHKRFYDKLVHFLKNYDMDNYLTVFKLTEILNNQKGATFRFGTCMPTTCRPEDIEALINQSINDKVIQLINSIDFQFNSVLYPITHLPIELMPDCYVKNEQVTFDNYQRFAM